MTSTKIQKARYLAAKRFPFLSDLIVSFNLVKANGIGTVAVDLNLNLYYDENFVNQISEDVLANCIYHECGHVIRDHFSRLQGYEKQIANIAGDLEINDDIIAEGHKLPEFVLHPEKFGFPTGLTAEEYARLLEQSGKMPASVPCCGSVATGRSEDWEQGGCGDDVEGEQQEQNGSCSANSENKEAKAEQQAKAIRNQQISGSANAVKNQQISEATKARIDIIKQKIAEKVKACGNESPNWLRDWAVEFLNKENQVNWRRELRKILTRALCSEVEEFSDYSRASKRSKEIIFPRFRGRKQSVSVVVDVSGSISDDEISLFVAEIFALLKTRQTELEVLQFDTALVERSRIKKASDFSVKHRCGGTNMMKGIEEAAKSAPDVIVVLTDGECWWSDVAPSRKPVIICCTTEARLPLWSRNIRIKKF